MFTGSAVCILESNLPEGVAEHISSLVMTMVLCHISSIGRSSAVCPYQTMIPYHRFDGFVSSVSDRHSVLNRFCAFLTYDSQTNTSLFVLYPHACLLSHHHHRILPIPQFPVPSLNPSQTFVSDWPRHLECLLTQ